MIEAFGCNPPDAYLAAMARQNPRPIWINLEYLSAEAWVEGCHGLHGRHPQLGLTRHFFFPGFTKHTGGLLRSADLLARRQAFSPADAKAFLTTLGLPENRSDQPVFSLFCYDNAALPALLAHWAANHAITLMVADGKPNQQIEALLGHALRTGEPVQYGQLTIIALPFLSQDNYDRLLWSCSLNFVRGEDSFVRAQWAGRPLVWHIYPQAEDAHMTKLDAFIQRYTGGLAASSATALGDFWHHWNRGDGKSAVTCWPALQAAQPVLARHAEHWRDSLAAQSDLLSQLASFAESHLAPSA